MLLVRKKKRLFMLDLPCLASDSAPALHRCQGWEACPIPTSHSLGQVPRPCRPSYLTVKWIEQLGPSAGWEVLWNL